MMTDHTDRVFRRDQRTEFEAALSSLAGQPGWRIRFDDDADGHTVVTMYYAPQDERP